MITKIISFIGNNKMKFFIIGAVSTVAAVVTGKLFRGGKDTEKTSHKVESETFSKDVKQQLVKDIRELLAADDTISGTYAFAQSSKYGFWGYYLKTDDIGSLYFCYSDELEKAFGRSPFWVELDEDATARFKNLNLKPEYDIYSHPRHEGRIAIPIHRASGIDKEYAVAFISGLMNDLLEK